MPRPIYLQGMGGLGDCLHQRSLVREYLARGREVWLETPWPRVYHDLVGPRLRLLPKATSLRTQTKNALRERAKYSRQRPPPSRDVVKVAYPPQMVRDHGSVLAAMSAQVAVPVGDFRLPIPAEWRAKADAWLKRWNPDKPLMIYRPLMDRTEWGGCKARNPDVASYVALADSVSDRFFVVSVADLVPGKEWLIDGPKVCCDVVCHAGELDFETLAALTDMAGLVFTSPGFAAVLGQAVGTPTCVVFGGYENGSSFAGGAGFAPYLPIEPVEPCDCFRHDHDCQKAIDTEAATAALSAFVTHNPRRAPEPSVFGGRSKVRPNVSVEPDSDIDLTGLHMRYVNPGELETLITLVRSVKPRVMIEVGCNSGRTAKAILRNVPSLERYIGIDVPPSYEFAKSVQRREVPDRPGELALDDPRFRLILSNRGTFDMKSDEFEDVDVVFIDGDHGEAAVRNDHDLATWWTMDGSDGRFAVGPRLIIHHDDHDEPTVDVRATLDAMHTEAAPIAHVLGTWLAFQRVGV